MLILTKKESLDQNQQNLDKTNLSSFSVFKSNYKQLKRPINFPLSDPIVKLIPLKPSFPHSGTSGDQEDITLQHLVLMIDTMHEVIKIIRIKQQPFTNLMTVDTLMNKNCLNLNINLLIDIVVTQNGFLGLLKYNKDVHKEEKAYSVHAGGSLVRYKFVVVDNQNEERVDQISMLEFLKIQQEDPQRYSLDLQNLQFDKINGKSYIWNCNLPEIALRSEGKKIALTYGLQQSKSQYSQFGDFYSFSGVSFIADKSKDPLAFMQQFYDESAFVSILRHYRIPKKIQNQIDR